MIKDLKKFYNLKDNCKILDIGCGKGFFLFDFKILPNSDVYGIDISDYAIKNSKEEIRKNHAKKPITPWEDNFFDLVISLQTLHNLHNYDLEKQKKWKELVKRNIYVLKVIEMKKKKQIYYTGKLLVNLFVLHQNGNGGLNIQNIRGIIRLFILNKIKKVKILWISSGNAYSSKTTTTY